MAEKQDSGDGFVQLVGYFCQDEARLKRHAGGRG